jgi:rhamnose transport system permease protein
MSMFRRREFGLFTIILVVIIIMGIVNPTFFSLENWRDLLLYFAILIIACLGQMMTIITGGIDLSIGSVVALSGMSVGIIMKNVPDFNPLVLVIISILIGLACGIVNGLIISYGGVHPLITTLATLAIYRGLVVIISGNDWVIYSDFSEGVKALYRGDIVGVNYIILIAIIIIAIFYYFLGFTRTGRGIFALGDNVEAAKFVGIRKSKITMLVYGLSGSLAGLVGIIWISRVLIAQPTNATGFEMMTIATCVVGGVSIYGGVGSVVGVIFGALLMAVTINSLELVGLVDLWKLPIQGLIILFSVISDKMLSNRLNEQLRKQRRIFNDRK